MPTVPDAILGKLKCVRCKRWLSCGPVRLLPDGGSICGRCHIHGPKDQYRHFAFEALACYFKFPCKNWEWNCPELLPFKKVYDHEKKCSFGSGCVFFSHPSAAFKPRKYLNVKKAINLEVIPDIVLEYLRCTNCAGYLSSTPVYVCRDGTSVCHRCSDQLQQGPNSEFIRDSAFETFVDIMIFPCIFRYRGCTQMFKFGEQMTAHETDCPYGRSYSRDKAYTSDEKPYTRDAREEQPYTREEQPYTREERSSRQAEQQEPKRNDLIQQVPLKEKGVIKTHSGHIYATITPNAPLFAPQSAMKKHEQGMFLDEFQRYRDNLAHKWGVAPNGYPQAHQYQESNNGYHQDPRYPDHDRQQNRYGPGGGHSDGTPRSSLVARTDSVYENTMGHPSLIQELRIKQHLRNLPQKQNGHYSNGEGNSRMVDNRYYEMEEQPRKMEYSVYS